MGGILIHLIPNPWLVGPSSASPSSPRLTSTGTPTPSTLSEHWVWCREGCGQVCTEQSQGKHGKCHPSQAGRAQHVTWEIQGLQAPPSPVQVLCGSWCGGCHLRGLSICLWLRWQAQRRADTWLRFLTPTWAWTIFSAVGGRGCLVVVGSLSHRTGSPGTFEDLHLPC